MMLPNAECPKCGCERIGLDAFWTKVCKECGYKW